MAHFLNQSWWLWYILLGLMGFGLAYPLTFRPVWFRGRKSLYPLGLFLVLLSLGLLISAGRYLNQAPVEALLAPAPAWVAPPMDEGSSPWAQFRPIRLVDMAETWVMFGAFFLGLFEPKALPLILYLVLVMIASLKPPRVYYMVTSPPMVQVNNIIHNNPSIKVENQRRVG